MLVCRGKVQQASGVTHIIADNLLDETELLNSVGGQDEPFTLPAARGDEARHPGGSDQRTTFPIKKVRDIPGPAHRHAYGEGALFSVAYVWMASLRHAS